MENQKNAYSGQQNGHDNRESLNGNDETRKDTQNYNNYDSHSEEKPTQTETVSSENHQDRTSGMNSDTNSKNGNQNLENYPSSGNDEFDESEEDLEYDSDNDDDLEDDDNLDEDEMEEDKENHSYDSEFERRKRNPEFPKSENSEFPSNL